MTFILLAILLLPSVSLAASGGGGGGGNAAQIMAGGGSTGSGGGGRGNDSSNNPTGFLGGVSNLFNSTMTYTRRGLAAIERHANEANPTSTRVSCNFSTDHLPDEFLKFLQMKCNFPNGPEAQQKTYCTCVQEQLKTFPGLVNSDLQKDVKLKLEKAAIEHQLNTWLKYYNLISQGQIQMFNLQASKKRQDEIGLVEYCRPEQVKTQITQLFTNPRSIQNCNVNQVSLVKSVVDKMWSDQSKANKLSAPDSLTGLVSHAFDASYFSKKKLKTRAGEDVYYCLKPGQEALISQMGIFENGEGGGASQNNKPKPSYEEMIASLEALLKIIDERGTEGLYLIETPNGNRSLLDPAALAQNLGKESGIPGAPNFGVLAHSIGSFPLFGQLLKSLSDDVKARNADGKPMSDYSTEEIAQRRKTLVSEINRLKALYSSLAEISDKKDTKKLRQAYLLTEKFLQGVAPLANQINPNQYQYHGQSLCANLIEDIGKLACAPTTDISRPAFVSALLSDSGKASRLGLPAFDSCHEAKSIPAEMVSLPNMTSEGSNLALCLSMQASVCQADHRLNQNGVDVNGSFEVLPNFNQDPHTDSQYSDEENVTVRMCADYSRWVRNNVCKNLKDAELEKCSKGDHVSLYIEENPKSLLATAREAHDDLEQSSPSIARMNAPSAGIDPDSVAVKSYSDDGIVYDNSGINSQITELDGQIKTAEVKVDPQNGLQAKNNTFKQNQVADFRPYVVKAQAETALRKSETDLRRVEEQMRTESDPAKRSELDKEKIRLEEEIARFKTQIEENNKLIADMRKEFEGRNPVTPEKKKVSNTSDDEDDEVVATPKKKKAKTGSGTSGGSASSEDRVSAVSTGGSSAGGSSAGSTGSPGGAGSSAPIDSVRRAQEVVAANSQALLETVNGRASQLTLTVDGQTVNVQQIISLAVPANASVEEVQQLMVADPTKLIFNGDGFALVEVTRPGQPPAYFKVKKDDLSTVAVNDSNQIPQQVRRWSASYASFMERLKANRAPAGQPNQESP